MNAVIELTEITKSYGKGDHRVLALDSVSLKVETGEFVAILGPSGSGKTTLMNIIGLIDTADSGRYMLDGEDITHVRDSRYTKLRNKKIGFVFQRFNLINKYTALYNVALPLLVNGKSYHEAKREAMKTLARVGLGDRVRHRPNQLSGGQIQRVAIARALIGNTSLILADEPTGALDQKTGVEILSFLQELNDQGKTIIMITHDNNIAQRAKRIIRIEDGRIVGDESIEQQRTSAPSEKPQMNAAGA